MISVLKASKNHLTILSHADCDIVELKFNGLGFEENQDMLHAYTFMLRCLGPKDKVRVLADFEGASYHSLLSLSWKARLDLFSKHVERSAVINASPFIRTALQGFVSAALLVERPIGLKRVVAFKNRDDALDWLAL